MAVFYYRIYDGTGKMLISTSSFELVRDFFYHAYNPMEGPYRFFVGGNMDDMAPFLPFEYPVTAK